jgi:hypothetical protein
MRNEKNVKIPLPFEEAVSDLLKVKPPKKKPKLKIVKKKARKG